MSLVLTDFGATTLTGVLQDFDQALDSIKEVNLKQEIDDVASRVTSADQGLDDLENNLAATQIDLQQHKGNTNNPHEITIYQIGAAPVSHVNDVNNPHGVTALQVGASPLGHGHSYNDLSDKPSLDFASTSQMISLINQLNDFVGEVNSSVNDVPSSTKPLAYGSISLQSSGGYVDQCSGYGIDSESSDSQNRCILSQVAADANYVVMLTPSSNYNCAGAGGALTLFVHQKDLNGFQVTAQCQGTGGPSTIDFTVFGTPGGPSLNVIERTFQ